MSPIRHQPSTIPHPDAGKRIFFFIKRILDTCILLLPFSFLGPFLRYVPRRDNLPSPDTSRISEIPTEIFLVIANTLPLESQFFLSRTCRRARYILSPYWLVELRKLPPDPQMRCLRRIACHMPYHVACEMCFKLHKVDIDCTPAHYQRGVSLVCCAPTYLHYLHTRGGLYGEYTLMYHHVQLALKYTRLGIRTEYLQEILRPWSDYNYIFSEFEIKTTETPRVVHGRFLHESAWDLRHKYGKRIRFAHCPLNWPDTCTYHIFHAMSESFGLLEEAEHLKQILTTNPPELFVPADVSCACETCRVEFHCKFDYSRWVVRLYRDLGTEVEP